MRSAQGSGLWLGRVLTWATLPAGTNHVIERLGRLAADQNDLYPGAGRMVLKTLAEAGGVAELSSTHEAVSAHHGNNYAPLMEHYYRSHRPVLFALLDAVELEATSTDHSVLDAVEFLRANRHRVGEYLPDHHEG